MRNHITDRIVIQYSAGFVSAAILVALLNVKWHMVSSTSATSIQTVFRTENEHPAPTITHADNVARGKSSLRLPPPRFILHVGPPKTATSTLHQALNQSFATLKSDNFIYQGKFTGKLKKYNSTIEYGLRNDCQFEIAEARRQHAWNSSYPDPSDVPCWVNVRNKLNSYYKKGNNIIVSNEAFSNLWQMVTLSTDATHQQAMGPFDFPLLQQALEGWDVLIVATYRHFWDWLPSARMEQNKLQRHKSCSISFPGWVEGMLTSELRADVRISNWHFRYFDEAFRLLPKLGYPIKLMNMYDDNFDPIVSFHCDVLGPNTSSCAHAKESSSTPRRNPSPDIDYDAIVCQARKLGWLQPSESLLEDYKLVESLRTFHETHMDSRPLLMECTESATLNAIWEESVRLQQEIVPEYYQQHSLEEEYASYWLAVEHKKYCSLEAKDLLLGDSSWRTFFEEYSNANDRRSRL